MEVVMLVDWASYKKDEIVTIADKSVIEKGIELKVFKEHKKEPKVK